MHRPILDTLFKKGGFGLLFALLITFSSCEHTAEVQEKIGTTISNTKEAIFQSSEPECIDIDVKKSMVELQIIRLEDELMQLKSREEAEAFLAKYPQLAKEFFLVDRFPKGKVSNNLYMLAKDTAIGTIYRQTKSQYKDISDLKEQLENAFAHIRHYYPNFYVPKVYTAITGLGIETFVSDSIIVLSLDFFLGPKAKYKPRDHTGQPFPEYILRRYKREYLVPACMLYISNKYNKVDILDNTLLADMIYYGKAYHFVKQMMPCTPDSLIIGYTAKQIKDTKSHETVIWGHLIERKAIYEKSHFIKNKYTGERPYTAEIGPKCPGKIGTWIGWRIIDEYVKKKPEATLQKLMENKDSKKIFNESKYRPK